MEFVKRKHPRLSRYDYSLPGFYYVTIHAQDNTLCLSHICADSNDIYIWPTVLGQIAEQQLLELETRYPYVKIHKYVVMPTHIHAIIQLGMSDASRPGLTDIVCAYKSIATRLCNQSAKTPGRKVFQTSFYETVLRNEQAYQKCWQYIENNPIKWILHEDMPEFEP